MEIINLNFFRNQHRTEIMMKNFKFLITIYQKIAPEFI